MLADGLFNHAVSSLRPAQVHEKHGVEVRLDLNLWNLVTTEEEDKPAKGHQTNLWVQTLVTPGERRVS